MNLDQRTLLELVSETHKHELRLEQRKTNKQRVRRQGVAFGLVDSNPPAKRTRRAASTQTAKLPTVIHPNLEGFLRLHSDQWNNLYKEGKDFITSFNRALRHKEELPSPPNGTTIGPKKDDCCGNTDVGKGGRPRRVRRATTDMNEDELPEDEPSSRKVLFHLDDNPRPVRRIRLTRYRYVDDEDDDDSSLGFDVDHSIDGVPIKIVAIKREPQPDTVYETEIENLPVKTDHDVDDVNRRTFDPPSNGSSTHHSDSFHSHPSSNAWPNHSFQLEGRTGFINMNEFNAKFPHYINSPRRFISRRPRHARFDQQDRFVVDTGGGKRPTITEKAWVVVGGEPGLTALLTPYQSTQAHELAVVSAVTKATVANLPNPVLLKVNYATLISLQHDSNEEES